MQNESNEKQGPAFSMLGFIFGFILFGVPAFILLSAMFFRWGSPSEFTVRWIMVLVPTLAIGVIAGFKIATK